MTSESSSTEAQFVATPAFRTSTTSSSAVVPQLLNYTLLEVPTASAANKDINWPQNANHQSSAYHCDPDSALDAEHSPTNLQGNPGNLASNPGAHNNQPTTSSNMLLLQAYQHAALVGSSSSSAGNSFADVLSSSYGLALNDFRGTDESSRDSGGGGGCPTATSGGGATSLHQHQTMSPGNSGGGGGHCDNFNIGNDYNPSDTVPVSGASGGTGGNFVEHLDTFTAEFLSQPIYMPDAPSPPPPPPPLPLALHNEACSQASSGSPTTCHAGGPPMSPSLPSFVDTYRHPTGLQGEAEQTQRYFKQEPSSAAVTPPGSFSSTVTTSSSYPSHGYPTAQQQFFPKKEFGGGAEHMSEFYQPPSSSFPQYASASGASSGDYGYDHHDDGQAVTSSSLSQALSGVMHSMSDRSVIGAIRNVRRSPYSPDNAPGQTSKNARLNLCPPPPPAPLRTQASGSSASARGGHTVSTTSRSSGSTPKQPGSMLCAVCGDNAACQHYGVRTCEGCKGFFKRTVQKNAKYVCLADKNCPVDKRRRNRCQFCRFQKCLAVGMVKEVVRTDSLKGRRGRLPSKPRSPQDSPPSPPASFMTVLVRAHLDTSPDMNNLDYSQVDWDHESKDLRRDSVQQFFNTIASSMEICKKFCERIPGMSEISAGDRETLYQAASLELVILRMAYRNKPDSENFVFCNSTVLHRYQCRQMFAEWLDGILDLSRALHSVDMDLPSFAALCALTLVNDRHGLCDTKRLDALQNKVINALKDHVTYNPEAQRKGQGYFTKILERLPAVKSLNVQGLQRLFYLKMDNLLPTDLAPPSLEKLF